MAKQQTDSPFNQDEFQRIFDEYRSKIEEITRSTGRNLESLRVPKMETEAPELDLEAELGMEPAPESGQEDETGPEAATRAEAETGRESHFWQPEKHKLPLDLDDLVDDDDEEPATPPPPAKISPVKAAESRPPIRDYMASHLPESQQVVREARREAQRIIDEAEKQVAKEARKKAKAQVDKILAKARQDADEYVEKARKTVEQERAATLEAARAQVENTLKEITEQARQESQAKSAEILRDAQERADRLMRGVTEESSEVSRKVQEVVERARGTIGEFEERLQSETEDMTKSIEETQDRVEAMAQAAVAAEVSRKARPRENDKPSEPAGTPMMVVRVLGERSNGRNGSQPLFFGMVETVAPPETCDHRHFKAMKRHLTGTPGIKQLQESASEKELSALFDITEPMPLLEILSKVPQVAEVTSRSDRDIAVMFQKQV